MDKTQWACTEHTPSLYLPVGAKACWLCGEEKPPITDNIPVRSKPVVVGFFNTKNLCSLSGCLNPSKDNSKYCSRGCSNKNARKRYKERKKVTGG